jgi:glucose/arabinose dehydrogenase
VFSSRASCAVVVGLALLAGGAQARTASLHLDLVASGFSSPVFVTAAPSEPNNLYVVEQSGTVRVLAKGKLRKKVFLDVSSLITFSGEQGLLSLAFSPSYASNHLFYVDYVDKNGDTQVVEYRSKGKKAVQGSARQILLVPHPSFTNHNGGQLEFGPDGKLYQGMGDGGSGGDPNNNAQNLSSQLGKLLVTANPSQAHPTWQIVGYGLRNPWRFSFDRSNGDLYIGDVGQNLTEEVDYRRAVAVSTQANYGWSHYEGSGVYNAGIALAGSAPVVFPVAEYSHSLGCAVTGGYVYRGSAVPAAAGRYFYADFCSGTVWSFLISGGTATDQRTEPFSVSNPSSFGEDARGELYVVSLGGSIYRLAS